jgi:hypothetical protein
MLVALFLPWYESGSTTLTAWQAMALDDVILAVAAIMAITAALVVGLKRLFSISVAITSLAILPAVVVLVITAYRLISPAPPFDVSLGVGAWLGLAAAVAIAVGAWAGATDEGPARRESEAERRATEQGLARSELLKLPAETSPGGSNPAGT